MKKLISTLLLAISTAMVALSATAAPQHQHVRYVQKDVAKHYPSYHYGERDYYRQVQSARDFRIGATLPRYYQSHHYAVDYRRHRLTKPKNHQQWLRINGDYVLVNVKNQKIVRLIRG